MKRKFKWAKKENENEEKKLCKLFWKIHYTIYTMSMRVRTQNEEMAKRKNENERMRNFNLSIFHYVRASFLSHISSIFSFFSLFHIQLMRAFCHRFFDHNPADENFNFHHSTSFPSHRFPPGTVDFALWTSM